MSDNIVIAHELHKHYKMGKVLVLQALKGVSFSIKRGSFHAFVGESGCGKTTTLNVIGAISRPTSGYVTIDGQDISQLSDRKLSHFRNSYIGFIFQNFNLIDVYTAQENIAYPLHLAGIPRKKRPAMVMDILEKVGMEKYATHRPTELSGGQKQRVAIARALVNKPSLVLADEPTANLDSQTGEKILQLMVELNQKLGTTFIIATHSQRVMQYAQSMTTLQDGSIVSNEQLS